MKEKTQFEIWIDNIDIKPLKKMHDSHVCYMKGKGLSPKNFVKWVKFYYERCVLEI